MKTQRNHKRNKALKIICIVLLALLSSWKAVNKLSHEQPGQQTIVISYPIVDTGQEKCYDNRSDIKEPQKGTNWYGQDAQINGNQPDYQISEDELTVYDKVTGLTWTKSPDWNNDGRINEEDKFLFPDFLKYTDKLNDENYGGYNDWRTPTIKELYSLIDFRGTDPVRFYDDSPSLIPFINTNYFDFGFGDINAGRRIIDAQYWSGTEYVSTTMNNQPTTFGVNFADGRIKGYGRRGRDGNGLTQYARFVRGNSKYGINEFVDNKDGTITDKATGLMWAKNDNGKGIDWKRALEWVQKMNQQNYLGYNDWYLPNAKELQSIVDYSRSPSTSNSAAINSIFDISKIKNEAGQDDYPFFWTSTTHKRADGNASTAAYIAFGRGIGSMDRGRTAIDVHGAGCQRSDPKIGSSGSYPILGHGPQGDVQRVFNYVRIVRKME